MSKLTSIEPKSTTTEEAEAYDVWFCATVAARRATGKPDIPHDTAMARVQTIIDRHQTDCRPAAL